MLLSDMRRFILSARQNISGQLRRAVAGLLGASLAGLIAISLSGCTSPAVFDQTSTNQFISSIALKQPVKRLDQLFNQRFQSMILDEGAEKKYRLDYSLSGTSTSTLSVRGAHSTLKNSTMSIRFSLIRLEDDKEVYKGSVVSRAASGNISAYYGQQKSQKFVTERLAGNLAEKVINKLILYPSQSELSQTEQ